MGYGEYTFEGDMNLTPFFEVLHVRARLLQRRRRRYQLFPRRPRAQPVQSSATPRLKTASTAGSPSNALLNESQLSAAQVAAVYGAQLQRLQRHSGGFLLQPRYSV